MIFDNLNEAQKKAVAHITGPMLVVAGAGSGKTKVLTHRIAHLLSENVTNPENILAVTFTNKAAKEMKDRVSTLLGRNYNLPFVGTFHSFCVSFLRQEADKLGYPKSFTITDMGDTKAIMKAIWKEKALDEKKLVESLVQIFISNMKNNLKSPIEAAKSANGDFEVEASQVYKIYQDRLKSEGSMDFDDLLYNTVKILLDFPEVLATYQEKYQFIMVDEYQDTNFVQYKLASLLSQKYRNLAVIGDDWQSIYSWRGADIRNILEFQKEYGDALVVNLEQNYRSKGNILKAANGIINMNTSKLDKKLWTAQDDGDKIEYKRVGNERDEAYEIGKVIDDNLGSPYKDRTYTYKDFAILYRTNAQSRVIEEAMLRNAIPYKIIGGLRFYERKEIKDMISYLRIIQNPKDTTALLRIINVPARKLGAKSIEELLLNAERLECSLGEYLLKSEYEMLATDSASVRFSTIYKDIVKMSYEMNISSLIKYIVRVSGYKDMLEAGGSEGEERLENVYELVNVAEKYSGLDNPRMALQIFLEEVALISDQDEVQEQENSVKLMTVHAAKGLEFPIVILPGLEESLFPHARGLLNQKDLEEERRLFYVALTRAEEKLYIFSTEQRFIYGEFEPKLESRFIKEIPADLVESRGRVSETYNPSSVFNFISGTRKSPQTQSNIDVNYEVGQRVSHKSWGQGNILSVNGSIIEVKFDDAKIGLKKLVSHIAPLEVIS